jgi:hypothetical protein
MSDTPLSELIEIFKNDFDENLYYDSEGNVIPFVDSNGNNIRPLNNDPEKYPFKPDLPDLPTRFLKTFTKSDLTKLVIPVNDLLENKIINEVNEIKYSVLKANNLGQKSYEHLYFVEHHTDTSFPDYFIEILDKLIDIFPESNIEYTLLKDSYKATAVNSNKNIHKTDYNSKKTENINQKDNGKYSVTNTIKISWT